MTVAACAPPVPPVPPVPPIPPVPAMPPVPPLPPEPPLPRCPAPPSEKLPTSRVCIQPAPAKTSMKSVSFFIFQRVLCRMVPALPTAYTSPDERPHTPSKSCVVGLVSPVHVSLPVEWRITPPGPTAITSLDDVPPTALRFDPPGSLEVQLVPPLVE